MNPRINLKYVSSASELPTEPCFAALVFDSITIPGDERSRTHPGHGYPESTETAIKCITFASKSDMEAWVSQQEERRFGSPKPYRVIEIKPLAVSIKTVVSTS